MRCTTKKRRNRATIERNQEYLRHILISFDRSCSSAFPLWKFNAEIESTWTISRQLQVELHTCFLSFSSVYVTQLSFFGTFWWICAGSSSFISDDYNQPDCVHVCVWLPVAAHFLRTCNKYLWTWFWRVRAPVSSINISQNRNVFTKRISDRNNCWNCGGSHTFLLCPVTFVTCVCQPLKRMHNIKSEKKTDDLNHSAAL